MGKVAEEFSSTKTYAVGDLCLYQDSLWRFTSIHTGAWNDSHAVPVDRMTEQKLTRLIAAYENTQKAVAYAQTVVFEPELITGSTNQYRYILTNADDPRK